jgi:hypothetical protein
MAAIATTLRVACLFQFELLANDGCRGTVQRVTINGTAVSSVYSMETDPSTGDRWAL